MRDKCLCAKVISIEGIIWPLNNSILTVFNEVAGPNNIPAKGKLQPSIFRIDFTDSANSSAGHNLGIFVRVTP